MSGIFVPVGGDAVLEFTAQVLSALFLARCDLGLGVADEILKLIDVESCKVDGCHEFLLSMDTDWASALQAGG